MAENDLTLPSTRATPRVGAIIQARLSSTRLPGKALLPLGGAVTLFEQVVRRARRATTVADVVVALPDSPADDALAALAATLALPAFRGSEADVLARFAATAAQFHFDVVVRLTADNPALDPAFIDAAVRAHLEAGAAYTITTGLPLGMNVEVISAPALHHAARRATAPPDREHVTPYLRQRPAEFRLQTLAVAAPPEAAALRLTVDYPSDYALLSVLYSLLGPDFDLAALLAGVGQYPWLPALNAANAQVTL